MSSLQPRSRRNNCDLKHNTSQYKKEEALRKVVIANEIAFSITMALSYLYQNKAENGSWELNTKLLMPSLQTGDLFG